MWRLTSAKLTEQSQKPDLIVSDLLTAHPSRRLVINVADIRPGRLTLLEALDIVDASGVEAEKFGEVLGSAKLKPKALLLYAIAWVIARRAEKDLTFEEVCTYRLEIVGREANVQRDLERAEIVAGVATMANVSPEEAKSMTVDEITAMRNIRRRQARRRSG